MAEYKISVGNGLLPGLLSEGNGMAKRVEAVLNPVLEAQMSKHLGAAMHERSEKRQRYRNGTRVRNAVYTRGAGELAGAASARWQLLHRQLQAATNTRSRPLCWRSWKGW